MRSVSKNYTPSESLALWRDRRGKESGYHKNPALAREVCAGDDHNDLVANVRDRCPERVRCGPPMSSAARRRRSHPRRRGRRWTRCSTAWGSCTTRAVMARPPPASAVDASVTHTRRASDVPSQALVMTLYSQLTRLRVGRRTMRRRHHSVCSEPRAKRPASVDSRHPADLFRHIARPGHLCTERFAALLCTRGSAQISLEHACRVPRPQGKEVCTDEYADSIEYADTFLRTLRSRQ
jgi:hypothetical protein